MKNTLTELVFILDRSGSMSGLEGDTIGGYNAMLKRQRETKGAAEVTTVLFDDQYELLHDRVPLEDVKALTGEEYFVRGSTALLDAIGRTIRLMDRRVSALEEQEHEEVKVIFVITTDGMENASHSYTLPKIRSLISERQEKNHWEFIFLGANIDALEAAETMGIAMNRASNFQADSIGVKKQYEAMNAAITNFRAHGTIAEDWKKDVDDDYRKRGGAKPKR